MGSIKGMLGLAGGINGTGFDTTQGTNAGQLQGAYTGTQNSMQSQQSLLQALQAQGGIGNQSQIYNQLQGVANGTGPNPAQAMLSQATGANVANQAALMAGQRGAGANPALLARQAAQQGAAIQQNAAGQGATLQAQQSLNALGAAGQMANNQVANQIGATNTGIQAQQNEQQILQGANSNMNKINADLASGYTDAQSGVIGGAFGGAGAGLNAISKIGGPGAVTGGGGGGGGTSSLGDAAMVASRGGEVPGPQSHAGMFLSGMSAGGRVPALVSPGEIYLSPQEAQAVAMGKESPTRVGQKIPGKAKVKGDSTKNDTVPRMLEPGGVVVKRSVMNSKDSDHNAAKFVHAVLSKKSKK